MSPTASFALAGYPGASSPAPTPMHTASGKAVEQSSGNALTVVGENRTVVAERLGDFLRAKHPVKTADNVAADTGIQAATVARWLDRGSAPNLWATLRLVGAYGAEVLCALMDQPPASLTLAARAERRTRLLAEITDLEARLDGDRA